MATYKVEIGKRFGQFSASFFSAGTAKPSADPKYTNLDEVIGFIRSEFAENADEGDDVIFRGIAFSSLGALVGEIRRGSY